MSDPTLTREEALVDAIVVLDAKGNSATVQDLRQFVDAYSLALESVEGGVPSAQFGDVLAEAARLHPLIVQRLAKVATAA